ncbi:MAG: hypothetical protein ACKUBY_00685 [Candidatus Moraniibacteriota bacterium]|jgi:hypothetical protein
MARLQNRVLVDFRKVLSGCIQQGSWQFKGKSRTFIIVNMPREVLADIRGNNIGAESCADLTEEKLIVVLDDASGLHSKKEFLNIYKKISFIIRLRKLGKLFDIKIDVGKDGRLIASQVNKYKAMARLAA